MVEDTLPALLTSWSSWGGRGGKNDQRSIEGPGSCAEGCGPLTDEACLPVPWKNPSFPSSELLVSGGVGTTLIPTVTSPSLCPTGEGSRQLLDAKVKLIANPVCNSRKFYNRMLDETMICAGNLQKPGHDTCQVETRVALGEQGTGGTLLGAWRHLRALGWEAGSAPPHLP